MCAVDNALIRPIQISRISVHSTTPLYPSVRRRPYSLSPSRARPTYLIPGHYTYLGRGAIGVHVPAHVRRPNNRRWRPVRLTFPTTSVDASVTRVTGVPSRRRDSPLRTSSLTQLCVADRRSRTRHTRWIVRRRCTRIATTG